MLNILGDSHVRSYSKCPNTRLLVVNEDLSIKNLKENTKEVLKAIDSYKHEPWLLIIGERDCRKHMFIESVEKQEPIDDIIEQYASKLVRFLSVLNSTYTVYGSSVSPTGENVVEKCDYFAPREIRQIITAKYNARLQVLSGQAGVPYLKIWKLGAAAKDMCEFSQFEPDRYHIRAENASKMLDTALKTL